MTTASNVVVEQRDRRDLNARPQDVRWTRRNLTSCTVTCEKIWGETSQVVL